MMRAGRKSAATGWAVFAMVVAVGVSALPAAGQTLTVDPSDIGAVLRALRAPTATEAPLLHQTEEGFLRFIGAPRGGAFAARSTPQKANDTGETAKNFVADHAGAFGVANSQVSFNTGAVRQHLGLSYVRLDQSYGGIPVFGAQAVLSVDAGGRVVQVMSDVLRDTRSLDSGAVSLTPAIDADTAALKAKTAIAAEIDGVSSSALTLDGEPVLCIFSPEVLGIVGTTRLTWRVRLAGDGPEGPIRQETFVDAHSGAMVFHYSLIHEALDRFIMSENLVSVLRAEGGPPTGNPDVDNAYDFLGDTYNFYWTQHQRDSIDGIGFQLVAEVGIVGYANASWNGFYLRFGTGWAVDDITAHEFTHGVTQYTSDLIYFGWSGAINESLSDMWGEWVDIANNRGDDTAQNRWLHGEELVFDYFGQTITGPNRNMKDPTQFGHPDALDSPLVWSVNQTLDNGGVHTNSGIGNKLCYLITDGGTFNGFDVTGLGYELASDLVYATQFIMSRSADYNDFYFALEAAAQNLGLTDDQRCSVFSAARAVKIVPPEVFQPISNLKATPARTTAGAPAVVLTWDEPIKMCASPATIVREEIGTLKALGDSVTIATDTTKAILDTSVREGIEYLYTLTALHPLTLTPVVLMTTIVAGEEPLAPFSEVYDNDPITDDALPIDLSFTQLTFTPTGAPGTGLGGIEDYELTVKQNVNSLPVRRNDANGNAYVIPLTDEGGVIVPFEDTSLWWLFTFGTSVANTFPNFQFPFFNQLYSKFYVSANGYIAFDPVAPFSELNFPTFKSQHAIPRISFLFGDLAPDVFGEVWLRDLPDRAVVTFDNITEDVIDTYPSSNTVQVELFHSGQIRITYLAVNMRNTIVGLSDGTGAPIDPAELFPASNLVSQPTRADFSIEPQIPDRLTLAPVPTQAYDAGDRAEFTITANLPLGLQSADPQFYLLGGPGTLIDQGTSARFIWESAQYGIQNIRVTAVIGEQTAFQDVRLVVGLSFERPVATDLEITSDIPIVNGTLPPGHPITANYTYFHPLAEQDPLSYGEGATSIYWYRNGQQVTSITNRRTLSSTQLLPGDVWQFRVSPATWNGIVGPEAVSPVVKILGGPEIVSVTPAFGVITGGATVAVKGSGLNGPTSVKFGGVNVAGFSVVNDGELRVVTPVHSAGYVDVEVTTGRGTGKLERGFLYVADTGDIEIGDVNGDGRVDALDVQIVVGAVLKVSTLKADIDADVNEDGAVNATDVQFVVNRALYR